MTTTNHPLTAARAVELWNASRPATSWENAWGLRSLGDHDRTHPLIAPLRATFDAGREHEREHADPHRDPRPWQDCTRKDIRKGDLVETQEDDILHVGVAHHQDADGDWWTDDSHLLTHGGNWPLRRIPAPTPPAEEVELPTEFPVHITDVEADFGDVCAYMALSKYGTWFGVDQDGDNRHWGYMSIAAFTLPDGTRARRHGEREDGTPRFVKEDA